MNLSQQYVLREGAALMITHDNDALTLVVGQPVSMTIPPRLA